VLEGHADERGTREYNLALGERRANSVSQIFQSLGVPADAIRTISYGEERPVSMGQDEGAWSLNRRVEILY
jgi:peptidoglycan-associated lipoprotein